MKNKKLSNVEILENMNKPSNVWIVIWAIVIVVVIIIGYFVAEGLKYEKDSLNQKILFSSVNKMTSEEFIKNYSQNIPQDWKIIEIENLGKISIPKTLEIRGDDSVFNVLSKNFKEELYRINNISNDTEYEIIIQPVGLDDLTELSSYARILISTTYSKGTQLPTKYDTWNLSQKDRDERKESLLKEMELLKDFNCNIEEDISVEEVYLHGIASLKTTYFRKCNNKSPVYVENYIISDSNKIVQLTLSYRITESDKWKDDFSRIVDTFVLTN